MLKSQFQVIVDGLVGDFTEQRKIRNPDFLLLGALKGRLFDLRFPTSVRDIIGSPGATKVTMFLFPAGGTS